MWRKDYSKLIKQIKAERYILGRMVANYGILPHKEEAYYCGMTQEEFVGIFKVLIDALNKEFGNTGYCKKDLVKFSWRKWLQLWRYRLWPFHF